MKQILLICAVVALAGCGQASITHEEAEKEETRNPDTPKTPDKDPLTKEEQAKIIEAVIRDHIKKPTGELTKADYEKVAELNLADIQLTKLIEAAIRKAAEKPTAELTDADYKKVTELYFGRNQLTSVKGLEKLTQLEWLSLTSNQITSVKGLEKLTQLKGLYLDRNKLTSVKGLEKLTQLTELGLSGNSDLTKAQIDELKKALPKCNISSNPTK